MTTYAIILAAGESARFGSGRDKMFETILGKSVLERSLDIFIRHPEISRSVLVTSHASSDRVLQLIESSYSDVRSNIRVIEGGKTRAESSFFGLLEASAWETVMPTVTSRGLPTRENGERHLRIYQHDEHAQIQKKGDSAYISKSSTNKKERVYVLLHDAARCLVTPALVSSVIAYIQCARCGVAPYIPVRDTIRLLDEPNGSWIADTLPRNRLGAMQTPQGADLDIMLEASRVAQCKKASLTDDVEALRFVGYPVRLIPGELHNVKMTYPEDMALAEHIILQRRNG